MRPGLRAQPSWEQRKLMQVTVGKEGSQLFRVNPAAGARAPNAGVKPWQKPNTTNRSACSSSQSAPGLTSRPSLRKWVKGCEEPSSRKSPTKRHQLASRRYISGILGSPSTREVSMSRLLVAFAFLTAAASSASAKPLHETQTCPEGQFYCAFISKCISSYLKCPDTKATSARSYQKTTKPY